MRVVVVMGYSADPMSRPSPEPSLPPWQRLLVVVAHPDDESFGLGAVIAAFTAGGTAVHVLCLTRGEASTLGEGVADLAEVRRGELELAGAALGVAGTTLLDWPDGHLDVSGVTAHPDHVAATSAAVAAATSRGLPVLAWTLPEAVAATVNEEWGTAMRGCPDEALDLAVAGSRDRQMLAVRAHASQAVPGSPLWRRLELLGDTEWLRWVTDAR